VAVEHPSLSRRLPSRSPVLAMTCLNNYPVQLNEVIIILKTVIFMGLCEIVWQFGVDKPIFKHYITFNSFVTNSLVIKYSEENRKIVLLSSRG
jgi:hypothetical protein